MSASTMSSAAGQVFDVDQLTGDISVVGRVDRELAPVFRLLIGARDRGVAASNSRSADTIVVVRVTDQNDNAPTININTLYQASIKLSVQDDMKLKQNSFKTVLKNFETVLF